MREEMYNASSTVHQAFTKQFTSKDFIVDKLAAFKSGLRKMNDLQMRRSAIIIPETHQM